MKHLEANISKFVNYTTTFYGENGLWSEMDSVSGYTLIILYFLTYCWSEKSVFPSTRIEGEYCSTIEFTS